MSLLGLSEGARRNMSIPASPAELGGMAQAHQDRSTLFLCDDGGSASEADQASLINAQAFPLQILLVPDVPTPGLLFRVKSSTILTK